MELGSDEGTSRPRRRGQKRDKPQHRRMWTTLEEECLVAGLRNLLVTGWKCENGFRNGYLGQLEAYIARSFPNADIKADPHITSKLHVWKKQYSTLSTLLTRSGLGWDEQRNMVTVEDDNAWNDYVKMDPHAKGMRSLPGFDEDLPYTYDANVEYVTNSSTGAKPPGSTSSGKRKRREVGNDIPKLIEMVSTFCETANTRLASLTRVLESEFGQPEHRAMILAHVKELDSLDENEHIIVANRLVNHPKEMELFLAMSAESRVKMARLMLSGRI
ncbi:UNVERIFIED_CONTAM: hypothetical protein Sindi_2258600 [Sesamum indicum]